MEKSSQTRAVLILLAWVTPWLPSWNSGVTLVRGAPLRMPPKKHNLANLGARGAAKPLLPSTPTTAEEYAATEEDTAFDVMDGDEEGHSS